MQIHFGPTLPTNIFADAEVDGHKIKIREVHTYPPHMVPYVNFDAEKDGRKLRDALEGLGTNEQCIIDIITTRSNAQRQEIAIWYNSSFDRDLIDDFNNNLSGKFCEIIVVLMTPLKEFLCKELHKSLTGLSTDEDALVEILCSKTNVEITQLIQTYDDCQF